MNICHQESVGIQLLRKILWQRSDQLNNLKRKASPYRKIGAINFQATGNTRKSTIASATDIASRPCTQENHQRRKGTHEHKRLFTEPNELHWTQFKESTTSHQLGQKVNPQSFQIPNHSTIFYPVMSDRE